MGSSTDSLASEAARAKFSAVGAFPLSSASAAGKRIAVAKSSILARSPLFARRIGSNLTGDRTLHGVRPDHPSSVRAVVDLSALVPQSGNLFVRRTSEVQSQ